DIKQENLERACRLVERSAGRKPDSYSGGPEDYRRMVERDDLDAVINATPFEFHTPVMLAAMEAGKYGATEVPAARNLEECWQLVETSERTGMPCMMLENYCYRRNVLMALNMVQLGLFGDIVHAETGYQHDCRYVNFGPKGELLWRARYKKTRNWNLYPTHAMGPVAWWMDINRGDRFEYLVSMSSMDASKALNNYIIKRFGEDHPNANAKFAVAGINNTMIRTKQGRTVNLYYDSSMPRPFDNIYRLQGTEGIYMGSREKIYLESRSPEEHTWEDATKYRGEFDHPIWKKMGQAARGSGHGGGDYMMLHQFLQAVQKKVQPPIDVYDAAAWSVISDLTMQSVANRSAAVDFPDFTRGKWKTARSVEFLGI
ncbi:MAG: gfo/Idh/MocA family oxidoreductase, partial [Gemmatimonadota bacterium]|nr:gfo/Idh/MocA family oxidoreductase [Gemmatimonadota bacterium]